MKPGIILLREGTDTSQVRGKNTKGPRTQMNLVMIFFPRFIKHEN
jgi:hypothetical protein